MSRHYSLSFSIKTEEKISMKKNEAIKIVNEAARKYEQYLVGKKTLVLFFKDKKQIDSLEVSFMAANFLHLTGFKIKDDDISPLEFYRLCVEERLSEKDFSFSPDGTTELKLKVISSVISPNLSAKMIGDFSGNTLKLYTQKLVGGTQACIGFVKDANGVYYPNTLLNTDIRDLVQKPMRILAVFQRDFDEEKYSTKTYQAKNIDKSTLSFEEEIEYLKDLLD